MKNIKIIEKIKETYKRLLMESVIKMKKITAIFLATLIIFSSITSLAQTVIKVPYDGREEVYKIKARYKDSKQAIPLSDCYDGYVYATIPEEKANKEIEGFVPGEYRFIDYAPEHYEFSVMETLAQIGVIFGNEKGEAKPFDNVTRAEATAMIMRMLGIDAEVNSELKFKDVNKSDWFYTTICTANKYGLVLGDSETEFAPERNVTREEIVVMISRAMEYASLAKMKNGIYAASDIERISEWAVDAYKALGGYVISDSDVTDPENPKRVLKPQKYATRFDVAYMIDNVIRYCQLYPSQEAIEFGFDEKIPVIDGSTSTYPFTQAVYSSLFSNGLLHPDMPASHSKSHASYEKLINGEIDMLFASVYPASDILALAEEKGVELELIPVAYDAMIFFTNMENPIKGLTKEQISEIYVNDAYENWSEIGGENALLYPYCRNNDSGSHAQMEKHFLNGHEIHPDIKEETTSMTMSNVLTDVMSAKTDNPKGFGLGYSIYYYFNNMDMFYNTKSQLKLLEIDGVAPNDETIANGTYPLSNNTYIVIKRDTPADAPARKMAEFMLTQKGQDCVEAAGFGRLK